MAGPMMFDVWFCSACARCISTPTLSSIGPSFALALSYALTMLAVRRRPSRRAGTSGATAMGGGHEILGTSRTGSLTRDATDELAWTHAVRAS